MDECFHFSYPHIRDRILPIAEKFDRDNYQVYVKSNDVCQSFAAACQILTADEEKSQVEDRRFARDTEEKVSLLLAMDFLCETRWRVSVGFTLPSEFPSDQTIREYLFENVRRIIDWVSFARSSDSYRSSSHSPCDLAEKNSSIDVLVKYLTHEQAEIRSAVYCSIAMLVAVGSIFALNSFCSAGCFVVIRVVCPWKKQWKAAINQERTPISQRSMTKPNSSAISVCWPNWPLMEWMISPRRWVVWAFSSPVHVDDDRSLIILVWFCCIFSNRSCWSAMSIGVSWWPSLLSYCHNYR